MSLRKFGYTAIIERTHRFDRGSSHVRTPTVGPPEVFFILLTAVLPTALATLPSGMIATAKQDSWIAALLAAVVGSVFLAVVLPVSRKWPHIHLVEISERVLGRAGRMLFGVAYTWLCLHVTSGILLTLTDYVGLVLLPRTPPVVVMGAALFVALFAARGGVEVVGRVSLIVVNISIIIVGLINALSLTDSKPENLLPIMGSGITAVWKATVPAVGFVLELAIMCLLLPALAPHNRSKSRALLAGLGATGILLAANVFGAVMVFGPQVAGLELYPMLEVTRFVSVADFFERLDPGIAAVASSAMIVKLMVWMTATCETGARWLRVGSRTLLWPVSLFVLGLAQILHPTIVSLREFVATGWTPYMCLFALLLPAILLLVESVKERLAQDRIGRELVEGNSAEPSSE